MPHHHYCVSVQRLLISCHVCPSLCTIVFPYSFRDIYVNIVKKNFISHTGNALRRENVDQSSTISRTGKPSRDVFPEREMKY